MDDLFQATFEYAMQLDSLTVGQTHVAEGFGAKVIMDHPLLRGDTTAWHFAADHEAPGFVLFLFRQLSAAVTVVLLVGTVVFQKNVTVLRNVRGAGVSKLLGELTTETGGGELDFFNGGFGHVGRSEGQPMPRLKGKASLWQQDHLIVYGKNRLVNTNVWKNHNFMEFMIVFA